MQRLHAWGSSLRTFWQSRVQKLGEYRQRHPRRFYAASGLLVVGVLTTGVFARLWIDSAQAPAPPNLLHGVVQKGPFVAGSEILIQPLNEELSPTGTLYRVTTTNDFGEYELAQPIDTPYVELSATGFYFNEVRGSLSEAQLTLTNFTRPSDGDLNINLLTTLTTPRIKHLIKQAGYTYDEAKAQAEREVLAIFNIENPEQLSFEQMVIDEPGAGNAILLAISAVMQNYNSVATLSEMLAKISQDLAPDGVLTSYAQPSDAVNTPSSALPLSAPLFGQDYGYGQGGWYDEYSEYYSSPDGYQLIDSQPETSGEDTEAAPSEEADTASGVDYQQVLAQQARTLDIDRVKQNLTHRYEELGEAAEIPDLERYAKRLLPFGVAHVEPAAYFDTEAAPTANHHVLFSPLISVTFNKQVDRDSVDFSTFNLSTEAGPVAGTVDFLDDQTLRFTPDDYLLPLTRYTAHFADEVRGVDNDSWNEDLTWHFVTHDFDITSNLLVYYPMDGDGTDASGQGRDAETHLVSTTPDRYGNPEKAIYLGEGGYLRTPELKPLERAPWTASFWIHPDTPVYYPTIPFALLTHDHPDSVVTNTIYLGFRYDDDGRATYLSNYDNFGSNGYQDYYYYYTSPFYGITPPSEGWFQLVVTFDGGQKQLFANGQKISTEDENYGEIERAANLLIGDRSRNPQVPISPPYSTNGSTTFTGSIDDFRLYERVLTDQAVALLYDMEKPPVQTSDPR